MGMNKKVSYLLVGAAVLLLGVLSTQVENRHLPLPHHGQPWPSEDHWSLVQQLFPGLVHNAMQLLAPHPTWIEHKAPSQVTHVFMALLVVVLLLAGSLLVYLRMRTRPPVVPDERMGVFGVFEMMAETVLSFMSGLMDEKRAHFFFPLIAAFAFFILASNLLGMVPGMLPPFVACPSSSSADSVALVLSPQRFGNVDPASDIFNHGELFRWRCLFFLSSREEEEREK